MGAQGWEEEEEEEEEEEGETGADVILLTESDHFIYLQRGEEISKALFNSISLFLLRLKDQAGGRSG